MALPIGSTAPGLQATAEDGSSRTLPEAGRWLVLYFYPKDNTSGCTREACDFRDSMERIAAMGVSVAGVSPDSVSSHERFKDKFGLNFTLVPDTDKSICNLYDVIGEKSMYGKKYLGVIRTTYIIDETGKIAFAFTNVKVPGHVDNVINKLNELRSK